MIVAAVWAGAQLWAGALEAENIRAMGRLKERIAEQNALFAEQDAFNAEASGQAESARYHNTIAATVGAQRAGYAAQNVDVNFGTAKEIQKESQLTGLMNQMDIQRRGHERALGMQREARNIRFGSQMGELQTQLDASSRMGEATLSAANTLATGYGNYSKGGFMSKSDLSAEYRKGNLAADSRWNSVSEKYPGSDDFWSRNPYK